ncbi:MAG: protein kinase [Gemmatimonadota bacterium]|nr:protein kinase [Gemmatimonadota bacterium]
MPDLMRDRVIAAIGDLYDVDAEIGRGGMAIVYRATDVRLRRRVAVKVLPPELAYRADVRTRFLREAETAAQLNHPNIVPIYSVDERAGIVFFVMTLVDGETVGQRLAREGRLPAAEALRITRDVADALLYAHRRGVVHRDIKPDNILLDRTEGRVLVTDFGIARAAEADSRLTVTGVAVGTPAYMSPEQAMGARDVDGRSDQYALGVVAYQMLAGRTPFEAANTPAMLMKHVGERPRPVAELRPDAPPALAAAVMRALAKQPEHRWPDAGAFRDALAGGTAGGGAEMVPAAESAAVPGDLWDGGAHRPPAPLNPAPALPYPVGHPGMSRRELREMRRQWRSQWEKQWKQAKRPAKKDSMETFAARPVEERITALRRSIVSAVATTFFLFVVNMVTSPAFPWFVFPAMGLGIGVAKKWGTLWADGVTWGQIFGRRHPAGLTAGQANAAGASAALPSPGDEAARLVPPEVLAGPHGPAVRRAAADRASIRQTVASLGAEDRALIPDVLPTVDALVDRTASLAQMLHRIDTDVSPEMLARIERRIADVEVEPDTSSDHERRLGLLQRQRDTLNDLAGRRARVATQLESAGITLGNLRLDLVSLRSSGVASVAEDVQSATREARALSKEIGHVLDAAAELRGM